MEHDKVTTLELSCSQPLPLPMPLPLLLLLHIVVVAAAAAFGCLSDVTSWHCHCHSEPVGAALGLLAGCLLPRFHFSWCNKFCGLMGRAFADVASQQPQSLPP